VNDTSNDRGPDNDEPGKWAAVRDAMRGWGTTTRLCMIVAVIEAPMLLWAVVRH
jgi:hypothetical protein